MIDDGMAISMLAAVATVPGVTPLARSVSSTRAVIASVCVPSAIAPLLSCH